MSLTQPRKSVSHRRLWLGLLLSVLGHTLLLLPSPTLPVLTLTIPAPELAVALAVDRRAATESNPQPQLRPRPAVTSKAIAAEPQRVTASVMAPSAAIANHLHGLLLESWRRHFIYPPMAHRNGWEGRVELLIHLDRDGRLHAMRIVRSSGYPLLDQDALLTLHRIGTIPQARTWLPERGYATTLPVVYRLTEG